MGRDTIVDSNAQTGYLLIPYPDPWGTFLCYCIDAEGVQCLDDNGLQRLDVFTDGEDAADSEDRVYNELTQPVVRHPSSSICTFCGNSFGVQLICSSEYVGAYSIFS